MTVEQPQPSNQNPATSVIVGAIAALRGAVVGVQSILQRMETRQSPGLYRIMPIGGPVMGPGFVTQSTRFRVVEWVIAVNAAGTFGIRVGRDLIVSVEFSAAGTIVIPLPVTIDRAAEITTTGTVDNIVDSFLIVYTE